MRLAPFALTLLAVSPWATSQQSLPTAAGDAVLHAYESCSFADGLQIVKIDSLAAGVQERSVDTSQGPKTIRMLAGRRIMFAYGVGGDFFANVKPELLPGDIWAVEKQSLLDELDFMLRSGHDNEPNTKLSPELHGLEARGFDRTVLTGGVLGFYLLFDNTRHVATSVYLLNQDPITRRFQTMAQYRELRDHFLDAYTACIAQNHALTGAAHAGSQ